MKTSKAITVLLIFVILSIGAVSAADTTNNTISTTNDNQINSQTVTSDNISNNEISTVKQLNNENLKSSGTTHSLTEDTYTTYFDSDGNIITSAVNNGDTIDASGSFTNKNFIINIPITFTSSLNNANLYNSTIKLTEGATGTNISNIHINNSNSQGNCLYFAHCNNITVTNSDIRCNGSDGYAVTLTDSNYTTFTNNLIKTSFTSMGRCHSTMVLTSVNYLVIDNNLIETDDANSIYLGYSNYVNVTNNIINITTPNPSAWEEAIVFAGWKGPTYNSIASGNTINGAFYGIAGGVNNTITGNTLNNIKATGAWGSCAISGSESNITNNILNNCTVGIDATSCNITGNTIDVPTNVGITLSGSNMNVSDNTITAKGGIKSSSAIKNTVINDNKITSTDSYTISLSGSSNVNVTGNYLISSDKNGSGSVVATTNDKVYNNYPVNTLLDVNNVNVDYSDFTNVYAKLNTIEGLAVSGKTVTVTVNGKSYSGVTDSNGVATININDMLNPGTYTATLNYAGETNYNPSTNTITIQVNPKEPTIVNTTLVVYQNTSFNVSVMLGNEPVGLGTLNLFYNNRAIGSSYVRNGVATFNLKDMAPGNYTVLGFYFAKAPYNDQSQYINLTVLSAPVVNNNVTISVPTVNGTVGANTIVNVNITRDDGKIADSGNVTITVNGVNYTSNVLNGFANVNLTLPNVAGDYNVTTTYVNGDYSTSLNSTFIVNNETTNVTNTTIGTNLSADKFNHTFGAGMNFTGKLINNVTGAPIIGQHIALNLTRLSNGLNKVYWVTTDTNGEYQLAINLGKGNYTAQCNYYGTSNFNPSNAFNTITVTA